MEFGTPWLLQRDLPRSSSGASRIAGVAPEQSIA
jgi:hypothetical protein